MTHNVDPRRELLLDYCSTAWKKMRIQLKQDPFPDYANDAVYANPTVLLDAIRMAISEIDSLTNGWPTKRPDAHKYAGYVARWIAKRKPVQLVSGPHLLRLCGGPQVHPSLLAVNAAYARLCFDSFLKDGVPKSLTTYVDKIFHNKDIDGETLAFIAYLCEKHPTE